MRKSKRQNHEDQSVHGYPRPQLVREDFMSLDGSWEFAIDADGHARTPDAVKFKQQIRVPFAPETPASGIEETGFFKSCWYRRTFSTPNLSDGQRLILHFGAVDYLATVWVNDQIVVQHEGGYTPFSADITDSLIDEKAQTIIVRAEDDPHDLAKPRGKQDWKPQPHSIWYQRTSGIWQSVWMERVNETHIHRIRWTPNVEHWQINLHARLAGPRIDRMKLRVHLHFKDRPLVDDTYDVLDGEVKRSIQLPDPGIINQRNELMWSPSSPNLIDAELQLIDPARNVLDSVKSYTAMRTIHLSGDRVVLNGKPLTQRLVLDQGYWPNGGLTAPDDDAYRRDVELARQMGFNGVRKHQKIESPRYLYWADKLGLMVWEEMPSAYTFSDLSMTRLAKQWMEAIERDYSHPCIIAWVPFNESWGVPDLPRVREQRHAVQAMYHLTRMLDSTRPVIGNDGWEAAATDIIGIHDYEPNPRQLIRRYEHGPDAIPRLLRRERPGHRELMLEDFDYSGQPIMLTEIGGIAFSKDQNGTWGYSRAQTADELATRYLHLMEALRSLSMVCGFCYTQFADTYQEANGLLYMDRTPKFPLEEIACATRGLKTPADYDMYERWRERIMELQRD